MIVPLFLLISFAVLMIATAVRSIPEDTCRPRECPDQKGPPLFGDAILQMAKCGPNGLIECGITQYPSMTPCVCPDDLVCVEQGTQQLWSKKSEFKGSCVGRVCNDTPDTPKSQRQCHSSQSCVHKVLVAESRSDGKLRGSEKGRCLSRPCNEGMGPKPCPSEFICIRDFYDPNGPGLCSHDSFKW
jgi:hypothetical protein